MIKERKGIIDGQGLGQGEEWTVGHRGTFWSDGCVLYLDWSGGYMMVCICQNSEL